MAPTALQWDLCLNEAALCKQYPCVVIKERAIGSLCEEYIIDPLMRLPLRPLASSVHCSDESSECVKIRTTGITSSNGGQWGKISLSEVQGSKKMTFSTITPGLQSASESVGIILAVMIAHSSHSSLNCAL